MVRQVEYPDILDTWMERCAARQNKSLNQWMIEAWFHQTVIQESKWREQNSNPDLFVPQDGKVKC